MNNYAQAANQYLAQRILGAGPEQQAALLMEAGQLFLGKAVKAMEEKDHFQVARCLARVTEIITEANFRLNHEEGGELVTNLAATYAWWTSEVFGASRTKDTARLRVIANQMGEIRQAWEQFHEKKTRLVPPAELHLEERVV